MKSLYDYLRDEDRAEFLQEQAKKLVADQIDDGDLLICVKFNDKLEQIGYYAMQDTPFIINTHDEEIKTVEDVIERVVEIYVQVMSDGKMPVDKCRHQNQKSKTKEQKDLPGQTYLLDQLKEPDA